MSRAGETKPDPQRVLYIDVGLSFGGALIVSALIARYLDPARYRAVIHSEVEEEVLEHWVKEPNKYYAARRALNYLHFMRAQKVIQRMPSKWLRRLASYTVSFVATVANLPFHARLAWIVHRERIDIIHNSNGNPTLFLTLLGRPVVATMAGIWPRPFSLFERIAVERTAKYIMISQAALDGYAQAGGVTEIAEIIPNPCDPAELRPEGKLAVRQEFGIGADEKVFAIVGRVVRWKGQKEFIRAAVRVLEQLPDARALLIGDAVDGNEAYLEEVKAMARESPHADRIDFIGYVHDVDRLYNVMDVAVHTSIDPEPFGLVVIEAMGFGVPIVAANDGGPLEIVDDGVDGYLVDPRDSEALSERIVRLLADDDLRAHMGECGRQKVAEKYHAKQYARRVQEIYDEIG